MAQNGLAGQSADDLLITRIDALNRLCDIYEEESISTAPLQSLRTAPSWADLASTLATLLTPGDTAPGDTPSTTPENAGSPSPLSALSDTDLRRWHTTLTLLPPFRLLPAPLLSRATAAAHTHLASRPSLHAYFVNNDFVS